VGLDAIFGLIFNIAGGSGSRRRRLLGQRRARDDSNA